MIARSDVFGNGMTPRHPAYVPKTTKDILQLACAAIQNDQNRIHGKPKNTDQSDRAYGLAYDAQTQSGYGVDADDPNAVRWSAFGAIKMVCRSGGDYQLPIVALYRAAGLNNMIEFMNWEMMPERTHADIMAALKTAIAQS